MLDRFGRNRTAFWVFVIALAALTAVPSAVLLRASRTYYDFLTGAAPATIKPAPVDFLDRGGEPRPAAADDLQFVEFRLRAPKAKAVALIGDFNGWKAGTLPLARGDDGTWEVMLPLPSGRYRYLFLVDGAAQPDPRAPAAMGADGRKASLRAVP